MERSEGSRNTVYAFVQVHGIVSSGGMMTCEERSPRHLIGIKSAGANVVQSQAPAKASAELETFVAAKGPAGLKEAVTERLEEKTGMSVLQSQQISALILPETTIPGSTFANNPNDCQNYLVVGRNCKDLFLIRLCGLHSVLMINKGKLLAKAHFYKSKTFVKS